MGHKEDEPGCFFKIAVLRVIGYGAFRIETLIVRVGPSCGNRHLPNEPVVVLSSEAGDNLPTQDVARHRVRNPGERLCIDRMRSELRRNSSVLRLPSGPHRRSVPLTYEGSFASASRACLRGIHDKLG